MSERAFVVTAEELSDLTGNLAALADVCQAGGAALARLHRQPSREAVSNLAPRPWVLDPLHRAPAARGLVDGWAREAVIEAYEDSGCVRAAVDEVSQRWTERHPIHGDLTAGGVLVEPRPALRVRLAEPVSVGLGDPAWDVAAALDLITGLAVTWHAPPAPLIEYFQQGYRRESGPGRLYPAMRAVRALMTAWQVAGSAAGSPAQRRAEVRLWIDRARAQATRVLSGPLMAA